MDKLLDWLGRRHKTSIQAKTSPPELTTPPPKIEYWPNFPFSEANTQKFFPRELSEKLFGASVDQSEHLKGERDNVLRGIEQLCYLIIEQRGNVIPENFFSEDVSQLHYASLQNHSYDLYPFSQFIERCLKGELFDGALLQAEVGFFQKIYPHFLDMNSKAGSFIKKIVAKLATGKINDEYYKSDGAWWERFQERLDNLRANYAVREKTLANEYIHRKSQAGLK